MTTACLGDGVCTNPQCPRHGIAWGVTEDLVEKLAELLVPKHSGPGWDSYTAATKMLLIKNYEPTARAVLAAVVPEVRRAVAEEIAHAIEAKASDTSYSEPEEVTEHLLQAAKVAREIGGGDQ